MIQLLNYQLIFFNQSMLVALAVVMLLPLMSGAPLWPIFVHELTKSCENNYGWLRYLIFMNNLDEEQLQTVSLLALFNPKTYTTC